ncbi:MAG: endonuclease/exonuclease/phosphatase family protein [Nitrospirota bacterium]|nr:endonuclease/exonuclease/phosphatase family protein [Nitrospirota bacterium]
MRLLSWNIQWCRGVDGKVDPVRIAQTARALCDPDILCLQEVAVNFPALAGSSGEDQVAALASQFPGFSATVAWGVDLPDDAGGRRRFGNLILSRFPVGRVLRHALPWPPDPGTPSMPRVALEAEIRAPRGPVRVTTTHLEYYAARQRAAQVERLRALHIEACAHADAARSPREGGGPLHHQPRPRAAILTGDFNLPADDPLHERLCAPFDDATPRLHDAWHLVHPNTAHAPSFRLYDPTYAGTPYCCDFVFVSDDLAPRLKTLRIDAQCQASDHQPVIVEFSA